MLSDPKSVELLASPKNPDRIRLRKMFDGLNYVFNRDRTRVAIYFKGEPLTADPIKDPALFRKQYDAIDRGEEPPKSGKADRRAAAGTWNAAAELWLGTPKWKGLADNTKRIYMPLIESIRKSPLGIKAMKRTTPWDVVALHNACIEERGANAANALKTGVLRPIVKVGKLNGWVTVDLLMGVELQEVEHTHHRPYEGGEIEKWRATHTSGMALYVFELAYGLAMATSDLIRFAPCHIDAHGNVTLGRKKTSNKQHSNVLADPVLREVIEQLTALRPEGTPADVPFLRNQYGKPFEGSTFRKQWARWREEAGIAKDFKVHAARATMVVDMKHAGVADQDAMHITGHADQKVYNDSYAHHADRHVQANRAQAAVVAARSRRGGKPTLRAAA